MASESMSSRWTRGGSMSRGSWTRVWSTRVRTSSTIFWMSWPSGNSIRVVETPRLTDDWMVSTLGRPAMAFSMGRVIWVSISEGAAPFSVTVMEICGKVTLGRCLIGRRV